MQMRGAFFTIIRLRVLSHKHFLSVDHIYAGLQFAHLRGADARGNLHARDVVHIHDLVGSNDIGNARNLTCCQVSGDELCIVARRELNLATCGIEAALRLIHLHKLGLSIVGCEHAIVAHAIDMFFRANH